MSFSTKSNKIVVVGIIGKTRSGKAHLLNDIIDVPVFKPINPTNKSGKDKVKYDKDKDTPMEFLRIESHLDSDNNILYLNMVSMHDSNTLLQMMNHFDVENMTPQEFHLWLENEDYRHMKSLLFMFHVCHIILIVHPGSTFDVEYLRVFRILQTFKQMLAPTIVAHFSNSPHQYISDFKAASSLTPGKCVPLVSFIFTPKISKKPCTVYPTQHRLPPVPHQQNAADQALLLAIQQSLLPSSAPPSDSSDDEKPEKTGNTDAKSGNPEADYVALHAPTPSGLLPFSQKAPVLLQKQQQTPAILSHPPPSILSHPPSILSHPSPSILSHPPPSILAHPPPSILAHPPPSPSQVPQQSPQILAREDKSKETDPMKKLEGALDSQIKALLKRAKLYLEHSQVASVITGLPLFSIEPSFGIARLAHQAQDATPVDIFSLFAKAASHGAADSSSDVSSDDRTVLQLVLQQVKLLLGPQGPPGRRAEYITIRVWQTAANTLQELLLTGPAPRRGPPGTPTTPPPAAKTRTDPTEKLLAFLDPDYKFSASRCATALLSAREQYLTGLPAHYSSQVHEKQLLRASAAFAQQARGPAAPYYTSKLRDDCAKIWVQGRHICDAVSLTGRPCVYLVEGSETGATHPGLHASGYHTLCTCNCGKSRRTREDPFDLEAANYLFFSLFPDCCKSIISLDLPAKSPQWSLVSLGTGTSYQPILGMQQEGFVQNRNFLSLVHFGGAPWLTASKMGLGHVIRHARQMRQEHHHSSHPSDVLSPQSNVAYYGYEYECPSGHRFFLEAPKDVNTALAAASGGGGGGILNLGNAGVEALPKPTPNRSRSRSSRNRHKHVNPSVSDAGARPTTPAHETTAREHEHRAVFTLCVACGSLAQLQRIFLVTPDWAGSFTINPKVVFHVAPAPQQSTPRPGGGILPTPTASPSMPPSMSLASATTEKYEFSLGMEVLLPKNAMVCLRLPYIYTKTGPNNKPVPLLQVAPNLPYIATASLGLHIPHMHAHFPQTRE